jgi:hypothetical protein
MERTNSLEEIFNDLKIRFDYANNLNPSGEVAIYYSKNLELLLSEIKELKSAISELRSVIS